VLAKGRQHRAPHPKHWLLGLYASWTLRASPRGRRPAATAGCSALLHGFTSAPCFWSQVHLRPSDLHRRCQLPMSCALARRDDSHVVGVCGVCLRLATAPDLPAFERSPLPKPVLPGLLATAMPRMLTPCSEAVACDRPCRQANCSARLLNIAHEAHGSLL